MTNIVTQNFIKVQITTPKIVINFPNYAPSVPSPHTHPASAITYTPKEDGEIQAINVQLAIEEIDDIVSNIDTLIPHKENKSEKNQPLWYAWLDSSWKIPSSQLPALSLTDTFIVNSEASQLGLTAQEGDVAIRTDQSKSYVHNGWTAWTMADWSELLTPTNQVSSVAWKTWAITLVTADITDLTATAGELNVLDWITATTAELNYTDWVTSNIQTQIDGKQASLWYTAENVANKENTTLDTSTTKYPTNNLVKTYVDSGLSTKANDSDVVKLTWNQTITWVKTFWLFPITPSSAPITDYQVANKKYVDDAIWWWGYTDEQAQDAVGTILIDSSEINFTYSDSTPSITADIIAGSIDETKLDTSVNNSLNLADTALQNLSWLDTDDLVEWTTNHYYPQADETKVWYISITQPVDLDDIETRVNALDSAVVLKWTWDASAWTFPWWWTAQAGDSYIVSVAWTVDSVTFNVWDRIIAITDNASTTTFASNWFKADYTDAVSSVAWKTWIVTLQTADISDITATASELNILDWVTATTAEINYVDWVTSNIQTQLDGKQATITGWATTITSANLTASRALVSDWSWKVAVATTTATEIGYLNWVTSAIQTQLNGKQATLVSWTNIKTVNWNSLLWSGNLTISWWSSWWVFKFAIAWTIWATWTNVANTIVVPASWTLTWCNIRYGTAWNGTLTVDINLNWTTLFSSSKPQITWTNSQTIWAWTLTTTSVSAWDRLTLDIDAVPATKWVDLYVDLFYS